jgi:MFS family permease
MLWTAQFVSDIGTWAQTVGAQWFLVSVSGSAALVALVQTATSLPVVLLAVPAGVVADLVDRRRLLIFTQSLLFAVAAVLCVTALTGWLTPVGLLLATFVLGIGVAASTPAWQSAQPDVVSRELLPTAVTLSSASINIGRSVGPALGGLIVALAGPGWTFGLNAISYLAVVSALVRWRSARPPDSDRERFGAAIRTGVNYVRHSPPMRRVVLRAALWTFPSSVIWALLPVLSYRQLHLGSAGYGLVLASLGVGAVLGALILAPLRPRIPINRLLAGVGLAFTATIVGISLIRVLWVVLILMMLAGGCWIATLSTINSSAMVLLPRWVRARGIGVLWVALQGGTALGAIMWGSLAEQTSTPTAFLVAAGGTLLGTSTLRVFGLANQVPPGDGVAIAWLTPNWAKPYRQIDGPVTVVIQYDVRPAQAEDFAAALRETRRSRLRSGARGWSGMADQADPRILRERYRMATARDAELLNTVRLTLEDQVMLERLAAFCVRPPVMTCTVASAGK